MCVHNASLLLKVNKHRLCLFIIQTAISQEGFQILDAKTKYKLVSF